MTTTTPIKKVDYEDDKTIQQEGYAVYATDYSGQRHLVAVVAVQEGVRQVALAFAAWHNVPLEEPEGRPKVTDDETL